MPRKKVIGERKAEVKEIRSLADLTPDERNANQGNARGMGLLETSVRNYGFGRSVLVDANGVIIAGNKTTETAASVGAKDGDNPDIIVVQTDGTQLVVVQRTDLDMTSDPEARELGIADNRVSEVNLTWDADELRGLIDDGADVSAFFSPKELAKVLKETPADALPEDAGKEEVIPAQFVVMVECENEEAQAELLEQLTSDGYSCRALTS